MRSSYPSRVIASKSRPGTEHPSCSEGVTYAVEQPELLPLSEMAEHFPAKDRRTLERFRVDRCLRVRRVGS